MSQAEALLNSLSTDEIAAYSVNSEAEPHIIIGRDKFITVPLSLQRIGVEHEHDIETVTFECPRYWDEHDLSGMFIYINYMLSNGYKDSYPVENVTVQDDIILFTWTISRNVTQVSGDIKFIACAKKVDTEGIEVIHWNTELCEDMYVSKGLETEELVSEEYPDLITELLLRVKSVQDINIQADEMSSVLAEAKAAAVVAEEAKNVATDEANYIKNSYANALKGNASGEIVRVDDVSPIQHTVETLVHGKNLLNTSAVPVQDDTGVIYISSVGDGFIEVTCTDAYNGNGHINTGIKLRHLCPQMVAGKQYILSGNTDAFNKCIYLAQLDYFWQFNSAIVVTEHMLDCSVGVYGYAPYRGQEPGVCRVYDMQIEEGTAVTDYEPYIDPSTVTIKTCGKNVFNKALSGVNFTNASGWCRGVLNNEALRKTLRPNTKYTVKFTAKCIEDVSYATFFSSDVGFGIFNSVTNRLVKMALYGGSDENNWMKKGETITCSGTFTTPENLYDDDNYSMVIYTQRALLEDGGVVYNKLNFTELHIELGEYVAVCENYVGAEYTPATDGTVDVISISPTTTIYTDTAGVTIKVEYNRDTSSMVEILDHFDGPDIVQRPSAVYNANILNEILETMLYELDSHIEDLDRRVKVLENQS